MRSSAELNNNSVVNSNLPDRNEDNLSSLPDTKENNLPSLPDRKEENLSSTIQATRLTRELLSSTVLLPSSVSTVVHCSTPTPVTTLRSSRDNLIEENSQENARSISIVGNDFFSEPISDIYSRKPLGHGTFGTVYKATRKDNNIEVVVKKIHKNSKKDNTYHEKFMLLNALHIPYLIHYVGCDLASQPTMFVFEYMPRGTLADFIAKEHRILTWNLRYRCMGQIALAMDYMHESGYLHCDLKLQNILINQDLNIRISDLDTVRKYDEKTFDLAGTKLYVAPELLRYYSILHQIINVSSNLTKNKSDLHKSSPLSLEEQLKLIDKNKELEQKIHSYRKQIKEGESKGEISGNTKETDVYALAIVMWSIASKNTVYYSHVRDNEDELEKSLLVDNYRESIPDYCPPAINDVITKAWATSPRERLSMHSIFQSLAKIEQGELDQADENEKKNDKHELK